LLIVNDKKEVLSIGWIVSKIQPPQLSATIIVKATCSIEPGKAASFVDEPDPPSGDIYVDENPEGCLRYESDFAPFKPRSDVLIVGTVHAPGGRPVPSLRAGIRVGPLSKEIAVIGDRKWMGDDVRGFSWSDPEPFTFMPITYEKAFGGSGFGKNPVGKGKHSQNLPNIEFPVSLVRSPGDELEPAGFGPLGKFWDQRRSLLGTYEEKWLEERWPWFPDDFDWGHFNASPRDQQIEGYLRGDEEMEFINFHPDYSSYRSGLPGIRPRCFLNEKKGDEDFRFREVKLKLDTLWVDMDAEKLIMVWRGVTDVRSMKLGEIEHLYVETEKLSDTPEPLGFYRELMNQRLSEEEFEEDETPRERISTEEAELEKEMARIEEEVAKMEAHASKAEADLREELISKGVDPSLLDSSKEVAERGTDPAIGQILSDIKKDLPPDLSAKLEDLDIPDPEKEIAMIGKLIAEELQDEDPRWTRGNVEAAITEGLSFAGQDLSELDLSGMDFSGVDFTGALLNKAKLSQCTFIGANLAKADLSGSDLTDADLTNACLDDADMSDAEVAKIKLSRASLHDAVFSGLDLSGVDLSESVGKGTDFSGSNLDGAVFERAKLPASNFSECSLVGANFLEVELQAAQFEGVSGRGINMEGADITGLHASEKSDFTEANFRNVRGSDSIWEESVLDRADFSYALLTRADFSNGSLRETNFFRAELGSSVFSEACMLKVYAVEANLLKAQFERADLTGGNMAKANLYEADFWEAVVERTDFRGANLKMTKLE
jgi:uncharacterized protein YjbI with pentapeptide repeats